MTLDATASEQLELFIIVVIRLFFYFVLLFSVMLTCNTDNKKAYLRLLTLEYIFEEDPNEGLEEEKTPKTHIKTATAENLNDNKL